MRRKVKINRANKFNSDDLRAQYSPRPSRFPYEEPDQSFVSKLISSLSEEVLKGVAVSIAFAVPSIRRLVLRAILTIFLLGVIAMALIFYGVKSLLTPSNGPPSEEPAKELLQPQNPL